MKNFIAFVLVLFFSSTISAQKKELYQLSSHILDISTGKPAPNVVIRLEKLSEKNTWLLVSQKTTDANGRVGDFLPYGEIKHQGTYKLVFETAPYFNSQQRDSFYPWIEVVFTIKDNQHYHVPITVSPFGYATYKGN